MPVNYPNLIGPSTGETRPVELQQCPEPNVASPFEYSGNLYCVLLGPVGPGPYSLTIWKSTDSGTTWNALDAAHHPTSASGSMVPAFDQDHTIVVAYLPDNNGNPISLINFDLATETWGAAYAAGGPTANLVLQTFLSPTGDVIVIYSVTFGGIFGLPAVRYSAGTWGTAFDVAANFAGSKSIFCGGVMDSSDVLHVFWQDNSTGEFYYQQVLSNDSLGASNDFVGSAADFYVSGPLQPIVIGNMIALPMTVYYAGVNTDCYYDLLMGTPLSGPVWSSIGTPGIDPASFDVLEPGSAGYPTTDGTTLFVVTITAPAIGGFQTQLRVCSTTNLLNPVAGPWTSAKLFDYTSDPCPAGFNYAGQTMSYQFCRALPGGVFSISLLAFGFVLDPTDSAFFLVGSTGTPLSASCNNPPGGLLLTPYSHAFGASGGTAPYNWAITAASLPVGISIDALTGIAAGIPTAYGTFAFTVQVTDATMATATVDCSIRIVAFVAPAAVEIILRGVKRLPRCLEAPLESVPEAPHVKQAV